MKKKKPQRWLESQDKEKWSGHKLYGQTNILFILSRHILAI